MHDSEWLKTYHSKLQSEYQISLNRKDTLTHWSLTILLALTVAYFGLQGGINLGGELRFLLVVGTLIILIKFFVNSLISYTYLRKWRFLKEQIEKYWMNGNPKLEDIKTNIEIYDHQGKSNVNWKKAIWAQLRAGFGIILTIPLLLVLTELLTAGSINDVYYYTVGVFGAYLIWEIITLGTYDKFQFNKTQNS